jgi:cytoskeleton protein RodZ
MTPSSGQATIERLGKALRAERERRNISIDAVSRGTLVRLDFLQLIDDDRCEELPSGAYAKGFIRAYATYLGLDWRPYAKAYEQQYAQPAPELSRVVRRGVRVPPAAQRRARKIAVMGAITVTLLLAMLGAFRSGEKPEEVPDVATAAARVRATTAPNPMGAIVRVEVVGEASWVEAEADGQPVFADTMRRGESRTFKGTERVVIFVARAGDVSIVANGHILGTPSDASYRGVFTPSTRKLPAHEPAAAAAAAEQKEAGTEPVASPASSAAPPDTGSTLPGQP